MRALNGTSSSACLCMSMCSSACVYIETDGTVTFSKKTRSKLKYTLPVYSSSLSFPPSPPYLFFYTSQWLSPLIDALDRGDDHVIQEGIICR